MASLFSSGIFEFSGIPGKNPRFFISPNNNRRRNQ
nr:MAG TPA: hypothetical protein [Caudoviricetes sp.]